MFRLAKSLLGSASDDFGQQRPSCFHGIKSHEYNAGTYCQGLPLLVKSVHCFYWFDSQKIIICLTGVRIRWRFYWLSASLPNLKWNSAKTYRAYQSSSGCCQNLEELPKAWALHNVKQCFRFYWKIRSGIRRRLAFQRQTPGFSKQTRGVRMPCHHGQIMVCSSQPKQKNKPSAKQNIVICSLWARQNVKSSNSVAKGCINCFVAMGSFCNNRCSAKRYRFQKNIFNVVETGKKPSQICSRQFWPATSIMYSCLQKSMPELGRRCQSLSPKLTGPD